MHTCVQSQIRSSARSWHEISALLIVVVYHGLPDTNTFGVFFWLVVPFHHCCRGPCADLGMIKLLKLGNSFTDDANLIADAPQLWLLLSCLHVFSGAVNGFTKCSVTAEGFRWYPYTRLDKWQATNGWLQVESLREPNGNLRTSQSPVGFMMVDGGFSFWSPKGDSVG